MKINNTFIFIYLYIYVYIHNILDVYVCIYSNIVVIVIMVLRVYIYYIYYTYFVFQLLIAYIKINKC